MKQLLAAFAVCFFFASTSVFAADLKDELVVIANKNSKEGVDLAKYYLSARGLNDSQLIILDLPKDDAMDRDAYDNKLVVPLRAALQERGLAAKTRVIVTTYGVPLRVSAPEAKGDEKQALLEALSYREQMRAQLVDITNQAKVAAGLKPEPKQDKGKDTPETPDAELVNQAKSALSELINALGTEKNPEKNKALRQKINGIMTRFGGLSAVAQSVQVPDNEENKAAADALNKIKHDVQTAFQVLQALDETDTAENRKRAYALASQVFGASGILGRANAYIKMYEFKEADASVDSELSFLWWERDQYVLSDRIPSPFFHHNAAQKSVGLLLPLVLTSRIDGADAKKARQLIDGALEAEKNGLQGNAYIDARGMKAANDSFGLYDENLRKLAGLLDDKTKFKVKSDDTEKRFSEPGEAPDTALYVGWYRLRHYEDAFTFKPGAIGYHIASEEAVSLHDPEETGWCKNAIDHGITVTLGAVAEPYLDSFPMPLEFFGLLLSGKYNLIEAYALTNPFLSWRMVLLGDPLYQPLRKPVVEGKDLSERDDFAKTLDPLPQSPLERDFPDPVAAKKQLGIRHEQMEKELDAFYKSLQEKVKAQQKAAAGK